MIDRIGTVRLAGADDTMLRVLLGPELVAGETVVAAAATTELTLNAPNLAVALRTFERRGIPVDGAQVSLDGLEMTVDSVAPPTGTGDVVLDHVVIHTASAERAVATYGGRLGLDLRLDRQAPQWDGHMLFFRCGAVILEVVEPLKTPHEGADAIWGVAWRSTDMASTVSRLVEHGLELGDVREGRKPGSLVCNVRDSRLGPPTIIIEHGDKYVTGR